MAMVKLGDNFTFYAQTFTPSTGAAVDADAVPGYRVYEDETGTPLLTGSMALLDDANTVGLYSEQIACTTVNGFEAGKCYVVRITGVVGGVTGVDLIQFQVTAVDVDDLVRSTTPANTLDVADTGEAGLDFANIKAASAPTTLTNITVPVVTAITNGVSLANDAITSAKFDESTAFPLKSADTGSTAVARVGADSDTLETLSDQIDGINAQSPATVAAAVAGTAIAIHRGNSFSKSVTAFGNISTRTKLWFSVKAAYEDTDAESVVQIEESGGLVYLNGAATTTTNGSLTVTDATTGAFTIVLKPAATAALTLQSGLVYDIKCLLAAGTTITTAPISAEVTPNVTLAVA